jgi:superfamily II DNA or RNA helicase
MAPRFRSNVAQDGIRVTVSEKSLFGVETPLERKTWARMPKFRPAVRTLEDLVEQGTAIATDSEIRLSSETAAALATEVADCIGLPPLTPLGLTVALDSRVEKPDGRLHLRWTERTGHEVRPERVGLKLIWGAQSGRLSASLLRIAQAAETYNQTFGRPHDERIASWMPVQTALRNATGQDIKCDGYLETFTIFQAGSFALDVHESPNGVDFTPILMSRDRAPSLEDDAPADEEGGSPSEAHQPDNTARANQSTGASDALLSAEDHRKFLEQATKGGPTRDAYVIGKNRYVLIDPALKPALDLVTVKRRAPLEERRAFVRNPKAALAEALNSEARGVPAASLFIETKNFSDRVEGLGLWERPNLPWLTRTPNQWLPESGWTADGDRVETEPLTPDEIEQIERDIEAAEVRGDTHIVVRGVPVTIDAAPQLLAKERKRAEEAGAGAATPPDGKGAGAKPDTPRGERLVLLIKKTNFDGLDYTFTLKQRPAFIGPEPPAHCLGSTILKPHQVDGFKWLAESWKAGWPGVLLADDMGLGKTLQALVFLAWIRSNAAEARKCGSGSVTGKPLLVVAPTALLKNWEKECAEHLSSEGLGERADAYGKALGTLKLDASRRSDPRETLDVARLREADWILTTYETLTDHELAFARIHYPVVIFDEMQKVKAPDTLNTKAARALNADFVLGLTGTPIENRMEDLWCIFDRIVPGYLGDLKTFSRTCLPDAPEELKKLKAMLDDPVDKAPPVMKRRMKADVLDALPKKEEKKYPTRMPVEQAQAYRELIMEASGRRERTRGHMLDVLHRMRGISLHPRDPVEIAGAGAARLESFAHRSARLSKTIEILRDIQKRGEKALIFIEHLAMQDAVADGIAALFDLDRKPAVINGRTPGEKRLAIVDAFAQSGDRFGVLLLSPKAAGVGLNIVAANHVIHLSRWWNPAIEDQCNDRAYRIGQTKPVTIHIPLATHPDFPDQSFDEQLDRLIESKRQLSRHMLAPPTGERDIESLFKGTVKEKQ